MFCSSVVSGLQKYSGDAGGVTQGCENEDLGQVVGSMNGKNVLAAQQIVASRIKMEGKPVFNPLPFLDDESAKLYQEPFHQGYLDVRDELDPPRVQIHATISERVSLLKLLNKTGRLVFRRRCEIVEGFGNGLFCVAKNLEVDRLILDGRPANLLQCPPNKFILTMGSANSLLGIHLGPEERLLCSGDDLSNFFYTFKVGSDRASRNFLDWAIPTGLVKDFPGFPDDLRNESHVYGCLNSLAMGDSASCAYAQTSHLFPGFTKQCVGC